MGYCMAGVDIDIEFIWIQAVMRLLVITVTVSVLIETGRQSRMHCTLHINHHC